LDRLDLGAGLRQRQRKRLWHRSPDGGRVLRSAEDGFGLRPADAFS
jgi:hypothetical protein